MRRLAVIALSAFMAAACGDVNDALVQLSTARNVSADLQVQFTKAADAANRAVMSESETLSTSFAAEAETAKSAVDSDIKALRPLLARLKYTEETRLLDEFEAAFSAYRGLDGTVLGLAVENTNVKAQALAFGAAQQAVDDFKQAAESIRPARPERDAWQVKALAASAVSAAREIQVLQAAHIPNADDAAMASLELQMKAAEAAARSSIASLSPLASADSHSRLVSATTALDHVIAVNSEIVTLSRRNSNVRSLAISLDQKQKATAACDTAARALHDALARRGYPAGR